jgi:predicted unusual protein kinase regulating ubiquinone biosynthesis (AarF/ABC1/UbiB family)
VALAKSFALPPDQLFDWIEEVPLACGSVGQVHRAQLSEKGAALTCCEPGEVVAVKVGRGGTRHSGVRWGGVAWEGVGVGKIAELL